jgi:hypothetical protein
MPRSGYGTADYFYPELSWIKVIARRINDTVCVFFGNERRVNAAQAASYGRPTSRPFFAVWSGDFGE